MIPQQISRDFKLSFRCAVAPLLYIFFSSLQILVFQGVDGIVLFHLPHCVHHGGEYDQKHAQYGDAAGRPRQMEGGLIGRCDCAVDEISMTVNMSRERTTAAASAPKQSRTARRTLCLCFFLHVRRSAACRSSAQDSTALSLCICSSFFLQAGHIHSSMLLCVAFVLITPQSITKKSGCRHQQPRTFGLTFRFTWRFSVAARGLKP